MGRATIVLLMRRLVALPALLFLAAGAFAQTAAVSRPRILGIDHVSFYTTVPDGVQKLYGVELRHYLTANGVKVSGVQGWSDHSLSFSIVDPEGHRVEFVERPSVEHAASEHAAAENAKADAAAPASTSAVSRRMIHAGFLVNNRDAEDHFYREL